jgi:hypothetical protein
MTIKFGQVLLAFLAAAISATAGFTAAVCQTQPTAAAASPEAKQAPGLPLPPGTADMAPALPGLSERLDTAYAAYKTTGSGEAYAEFLRLVKALLYESATKPAAALIKGSPSLTDVGAKAIDLGGGRIFLFPKVTASREAIVQWNEQKAQVSFVGRRHRIKKVTYTTTSHLQSLFLPPSVTLKAGHVSGPILILVGDERGSRLWLRAYRSQDGAFKEAGNYFESIPAFLTENVCGKVGFRGSDLIFSVARLGTRADGVNLPEGDSSTYRFLVRPTDNGYQLDSHLADEEQFAVIHQFLDLVAQGRTDAAKSLLADPKLLSIPKYVGLRKAGANFRIVEMAPPPTGAVRFRLVTFAKDDIIFDIGKIKDKDKQEWKSVVKAMFIAPPDAFLSEIAQHLPLYDRLVEAATPSAASGDDSASVKH